MKVLPVSFKEFLYSADRKAYGCVEGLQTIEPLPEIVNNRLAEEYKRYQICGGMPEVVSTLLYNNGMEDVEKKLQDILDLYTLDFSKYAKAVDIPRINNIWDSLPSQLSKENKKFIYSVIKSGARAREYEDALLWLEEAGLVYRAHNVSKPRMPLSAYKELSAFKLYCFDSGLLRRLAKLPTDIILSGHIGYTEFKGALTENNILHSLIPQFDAEPYYWSSENRAGVDFLLQTTVRIVPIEVKAETRISGKSLSVYTKKFESKLRIRYSTNNLKINDGLLSIPICLSDWTAKLIGLVKSIKNF